MTLEEILRVPTYASPMERAGDIWDDDNRLCYSENGEKVLDAENFPSEITVKDGCRIICNGVFAFQDYMAGLHIGEEVPLEDRSSYLERIKLPSTITHIGDEAFAECGDLLSIKLPISLLFIGEAAFVDCWQLERISFPASLRAIGPGAFQGCINLISIKFGKQVEMIGEDAFDDCESLEKITVPKGYTDHYKALLPKELHKLIKEL